MTTGVRCESSTSFLNLRRASDRLVTFTFAAMPHLFACLFPAVVDGFISNEKLVALVPITDPLNRHFAVPRIDVIEDPDGVVLTAPELPSRVEDRWVQRLAIFRLDIRLVGQPLADLPDNFRAFQFAKPLQIAYRIIGVPDFERRLLGHGKYCTK